jgi:transcriptional regulator with XRE-family HTH domain
VPAQDVEDVARHVGRRVAELRQKSGLTQQGLGSLVSASVQWISRIENGEENLTLGTLVKLANALQVRVADFFQAPQSNVKARRGRPEKA